VTTKAIFPDSFPTRDFPESDTTVVGVFAQDEIKHDAWSIIPGLRFDYYELKPEPDAIFTTGKPGVVTTETVTEHAVSPKLGLVYRLTAEYTLFGQYAHGFRAPPYDDLNASFTNPGAYTAIPNPNLKPEKSRGIEAGFRGNFGSRSFGVTGFYTRYKDFIDSQHSLNCPADPNCDPGTLQTFQAVNINNVRIYGAEARGEAALGGGFSVNASIAYAHGDDTDLDQPINPIDPLKLVTGLRYDAGNVWGMELIGTFVERKHRINPTTTPVLQASPGFGIFDLTAYWNVTKRVSLNAGVFNITDRKYFLWSDLQGTGGGTTPFPGALSIDRFSQPGRNGAITLKYQFI
jgi:hemoglobin/transferrin/lactoferrin receptor protein